MKQSKKMQDYCTHFSDIHEQNKNAKAGMDGSFQKFRVKNKLIESYKQTF